MSTVADAGTSGYHKDLIVVDHDKLDSMSQGELVALAKDINGKAIKAAKQTLIHAGQTGLVLIALKAKIPHGQFLKYVESLTEIGHRTATTYMMIARHYGSVSNLRGVRDAVRFIRESASAAKRIEVRQAESVRLPTPSPASHATIEVEIMEPSPARAPQYDEAALRLAAEHGVTPAEVVRAGVYAEAVEALPVSADFDGKNFYDIILVMLPHLTKEEIKSLSETINTRWL